MKRTYWKPVGKTFKGLGPSGGESRYMFPCGDHYFFKWSNSNVEREKFIREQNIIIRQCESDEEYIKLYKNIQLIQD